MTPTSDQIRSLLTAVAESVIAHAEELTELDQAIGDGDHGLNMKRGFEAVLAERDAICAKPLNEALKAAGMQLVMKVGGASGPLYGIIDQPFIGERFEGGFGRAEVTGPTGRHALRTRTPRPLSEAILFTTFPEVGIPEEGAAFNRVKAKARLTRYGLDCYAYALIAAGQIDLVIEAGLQAYDVQAPIAVIGAAGGIVTDWQGRPAHDGGRILAAANAAVHAEALALLNG